MGGDPVVGENEALTNALTEYANRTNLDDFSSLTDFLEQLPQSRWRASLLIHMGNEYYNFGYYSKALSTWEQAWKDCKEINGTGAKAQTDLALGYLARMYSKLGRMTELRNLLDSVKTRTLTGPAVQLVGSAKHALWMMENQPEFCFRCGPLALDELLSTRDPSKAANPLVLRSRSTTNGVSLGKVAELSSQLGLHYQMAFRSPDAPIIVPAVVHWKVGHYAAILSQNGDRFLVKDHTFHSSLWMTRAAIEDESSGYFLVPTSPLPKGWRLVSGAEGREVWGRGVTSTQDPNATTPYDTQVGEGGSGDTQDGEESSESDAQAGEESSGSCQGMPVYSISAMLVSLRLNDSPVGYRPPVGPSVRFTASYNQLEANQPATFYYSNLGPLWTCNWIAYITDNPNDPDADVSFYVDGGGTLNFTGYNPVNGTYAMQLVNRAILTKTSNDTYSMRFPDGSANVFGLSDGSSGTIRRIFLTQITDPAGNCVQLNYDSILRITNIVDAIGQATTFSYGNLSFPYEITKVTDPFGRSAYLQYDPSGLLTQITDVLGLSSQFNYGTNDFITAMTTPYGTTTFNSGTTNGVTWLQTTDPMGESELVEYTENQDLPFSDPGLVPSGMPLFNEYLYGRDSFYWNRKAFEEAAGDLTRSEILHFLHDVDDTQTGRVLDSIKKPLESRVWYDYPGQTSAGFLAGVTANKPSLIGRVLDDGSTQLYTYAYDSFGNLTNSIDPVGRSFSFDYSTNGVDLLAVRMTHNGKSELLSSATYNSQHSPLAITDASGQTSTNTYNGLGQILTTTDPKGELTTFSYDTNGYLLSETGPLQTTNDFSSFTYDAFGRIATVTDTEGYTIGYQYDAMDRPTNITFPDGTDKQLVYDRLDLVATSDRLGRWTTNIYNADRQLVQTRDRLGRITSFDWCKCGALTALIDPMGRTTTWQYDVQGRPKSKQYPDGSTVRYIYENSTSRLHSRIDEKGQETVYQYNLDNTIANVSYPNAIISTPTVSFTYDPDYQRVVIMHDGIGQTAYAYNLITSQPALGAGHLASVSGPLPNSTISYQYDQLGRVVNRTVDGTTEATTYDRLGRPEIVTNALGSFIYTYRDATWRLASVNDPNGQTAVYSYYGNLGDDRLEQIQNQYPNHSLLSAFGYAYNAVGDITTWTNQWDSFPTRVWYPAYDAADQLTNVSVAGGSLPVTVYAYAYDFAGNRVSAATNGVSTQYYYNDLNQLIGSSGGLPNVTYEWDAENHLSSISGVTSSSEFSYDGLGRRIGDIEEKGGSGGLTNYYLWHGRELCEERDFTGAHVIKRFYPQGEVAVGAFGNTNYFYTRDHLHSVREALNANATLVARYDYDPYGQETSIFGNFSSTFAFGGYFLHQDSGLYFTMFRALQGSIGRWLNRDPLQEKYGLNLYAYVENNPVKSIDNLGLCDQTSEPTPEPNPTPTLGPSPSPGSTPTPEPNPAPTPGQPPSPVSTPTSESNPTPIPSSPPGSPPSPPYNFPPLQPGWELTVPFIPNIPPNSPTIGPYYGSEEPEGEEGEHTPETSYELEVESVGNMNSTIYNTPEAVP